MSSDDRPLCRYCEEPATHGTRACCWCFLVQEKGVATEGCPGCKIAARRLEPILARYRTTIEATRENCVAVIQAAKLPTETMPRALRVNFRNNPELALQRVVEVLVDNLTQALRERVRA